MVEPGAGGLLFLPYLAGERAPLFDEARGAFIGLTLAHGRAELARAVLEGAAFAMRSLAEPLAAAGAPIRELRPAVGRPGDAWARIKPTPSAYRSRSRCSARARRPAPRSSPRRASAPSHRSRPASGR